MKKNFSKQTEYQLDDIQSLKLLQKRAKFKYIDKYAGKESKQFKKAFKQRVFQDFIHAHAFPPLVIAQIAILGRRGLGVVATKDIRLDKKDKPKKLGIYWGELSLEFTHLSHYVFVVSKYEIDAKKYGNWTRFVNHSKGNYNVIALQKFKRLGSKRLPYIEYALIKNVKAGDQLLVDYGPQYEFDAKHQIFLNPSNNALSAQEIYALNRQHYVLLSGKMLALYKKLYPKVKKAYVPNPFMQVLQQMRPISRRGRIKSEISLQAPILHANQRGQILAEAVQPEMTVLMLAAYMGNANAVRTFIKNYAANVNQQHIRTGLNALFYAIQTRGTLTQQKKMIDDLVNAGIHLSTQDIQGFTALHCCVKQKNLIALKLILTNKKYKYEAMEALDVLDKDNLCPVTYAMVNGEVKIVKYLLEVFEKYYKENFFHARHNKWLLPVAKKIFKNYAHKNLAQMLRLLVNKGLNTNRKLSAMLKTRLDKI